MFPKVQKVEVPSGARIVLLGDPHGDLGTAQAIVRLERGMDPQTVIACVGDAIGYEGGAASSAMVEWLAECRIPTILGNHEEWYFNQNQLSVVTDRHAERELTEAAVAWISALPHRIDFVTSGTDTAVGTLVHSIRTPSWDDVQPHSIARLERALPGVRLAFVGHSHCARVMAVGSDGSTKLTSFDYTQSERCDVELGGASFVVVDAGSVGRPRTDLRQMDRPSTFGTYAVVDPARRVAGLRRIARATRL